MIAVQVSGSNSHLQAQSYEKEKAHCTELSSFTQSGIV